ncbi:prephenate/arogenate dehydrogenase family protein [Sphingomonas parva]|uniref:prephenate dehydrogenase n=1 Tax=Sphingomonas parva TaxID=2555898 RepID=A0A4Y8ZSN1_9SPHN|nr:prephenate/arogenate dehydrogenase family protein [Sphingomonas parva]TFI59013.1 prephenate/arogenate dehydrogenase family protein [Sphingomonas parva]
MADSRFNTVALIGLGLIGSSIARAVRETLPETALRGHDADPAVRARAAEIGLVDAVAETAGAAVEGADLVIFCVPVGAMAAAAEATAGHLAPGAVISDVGSSKSGVAAALRHALSDATIVPAHPVAGTENSGPDAGFASLFRGRWCILTPEEGTDPGAVARLSAFWSALGARVEVMDAAHHDLVLAVTSHLPHLIAYTIVGTASDIERVTEGEVIKYSAGGFRDFTRIAASNPTMWRDIFLSNKQAVLETLQRFSEDLFLLQRAIRDDDGETLFNLFTRTRAIRRGIVEQGQDVARPDFGRQMEAGAPARDEQKEP